MATATLSPEVDNAVSDLVKQAAGAVQLASDMEKRAEAAEARVKVLETEIATLKKAADDREITLTKVAFAQLDETEVKSILDLMSENHLLKDGTDTVKVASGIVRNPGQLLTLLRHAVQSNSLVPSNGTGVNRGGDHGPGIGSSRSSEWDGLRKLGRR